MQLHLASRIATIALCCFAGPSIAAVAEVTPQSFVISHRAEVNATPAAVYAALAQMPRWWNPQHSYSGKSENLSLDVRAGGCWCEQWDGGSVEHARVVLAWRDKLLRLEGGFGPLQDLAVTAVLTFGIATAEGKTTLVMNYRVRGPDANLDKLAPIVDKVLVEGFERLVAFASKT
jgi:uncharacterized protein YndB with AHSA1/START domain